MTAGQEPKIEKRELKKASKIHFLIHPGFGSDRVLWDLYFEEAMRLGNDEVMFAFPFISGKGNSMRRALSEDEGDAETLLRLREILGRRLVVIADDFDILRDKTVGNSIEKVNRILNARGYYFDKDVLTEAYGEALSHCVSLGAENINRTYDLAKKTKVRSELTDVAVARGGDRRNLDMDKLEEIREVIKLTIATYHPKPEGHSSERLDIQ